MSDELLRQYRKTRDNISKLIEDSNNSWPYRQTLRDLDWTIFYMEHGYTPDVLGEQVGDFSVDPADLDKFPQPEKESFHDPPPEEVLEPYEGFLSDRQYEVLKLRIDGHSNSEISEILSVSRSTVRVHYDRAITKIQALFW